MKEHVSKIWNIFRYIFIATAIITILGVIASWCISFYYKQEWKLPYLNYLLTTLVVEVIGYIFALAKYGFKYLPRIETKKDLNETREFIKNFINHASTVTIVSNRLSWIDEGFLELIRDKQNSGTKFKIYIPQPEKNNQQNITKIKECLSDDLVIHNTKAPEARFTLINYGRSGAEKLAISEGTYPDHNISIFDHSSGAQIIGMAKDIIRQLKDLTDAP